MAATQDNNELRKKRIRQAIRLFPNSLLSSRGSQHLVYRAHYTRPAQARQGRELPHQESCSWVFVARGKDSRSRIAPRASPTTCCLLLAAKRLYILLTC